MAGSLILGVAYGIDVQPNNDPYIATAETALHAISMAGNAGAYLVDYIPICERLPQFVDQGTDVSCCSEAHPLLVPRSDVQASGCGMEESHRCNARAPIHGCHGSNGELYDKSPNYAV